MLFLGRHVILLGASLILWDTPSRPAARQVRRLCSEMQHDRITPDLAMDVAIAEAARWDMVSTQRPLVVLSQEPDICEARNHQIRSIHFSPTHIPGLHQSEWQFVKSPPQPPPR